VVDCGATLDGWTGDAAISFTIGAGRPADLRLIKTAQEYDSPIRMIETVAYVNEQRKRAMGRKIIQTLGGSVRGKTIAILGLTFKPNTDDMREAPAIDIIHWVTSQGARVKAYDPVATKTARSALEHEEVNMEMITFSESAYEVAEDVDALVVVTEWNEFLSLDIPRLRRTMRRPILIDGRNIYEPAEMERHGFIYRGIGRSSAPAFLTLTPGENIEPIQAFAER